MSYPLYSITLSYHARPPSGVKEVPPTPENFHETQSIQHQTQTTSKMTSRFGQKPSPSAELNRLNAEMQAASAHYAKASSVHSDSKREHLSRIKILNNAQGFGNSLEYAPETDKDFAWFERKAQWDSDIACTLRHVAALRRSVEEARGAELRAEQDAAVARVDHVEARDRYYAQKKAEKDRQQQEARWAKEDQERREYASSDSNDHEGGFSTSNEHLRTPPQPEYQRQDPPPTPKKPRGFNPRAQTKKPWNPPPFVPPEQCGPGADTPRPTPQYSTKQSAGSTSRFSPDQAAIVKYFAAVDAAFANYSSMAHFPCPPAWNCNVPACGLKRGTRMLDACEHNIEYVFRGKILKQERLKWHPDKFSSMPDAENMRKKAQEVFVALDVAYNRSKQ